VPPLHGCPHKGLPYPEVTGAFCRVPSTSFAQSPWYSLPVHPCRFGVRSLCWGYFLERLRCLLNPIRTDNLQHSSPSSRPRNINLVPIDYAFRPRLRGRLTLRGLTLRRNPWTFGGHVSHMPLTLLMSAFALPIPPEALTSLPSQAYGTLRYHITDVSVTSAASVYGLSPDTFSAQASLTRPVSYYAFFKGWLLLSQPPGCLGLPTSFPT
jgi:hypothetical protein